MTDVIFYKPDEIPDGQLKYAVIVTRYLGKWIFSRHRQRTTWEIPGGHREPGENIADTARRELYEETGTADCDIKPVCVYGVGRGEKITCGMLYLADVKKLGKLPAGTEIGEIKLFDIPPEELTYPEIQPRLFKYIQIWLNTQSSPDELWDVWDENRQPTGRIHRRGDPLGEGEYHLVVHIWIQNSRGEILLTKRAPTKGFPNTWECTGGSALTGDDSLKAALREVSEETGLTLNPDCGECIMTRKGRDYFCDVWMFRQDFELTEVRLQEAETCDVIWASPKKIQQLRSDGIMAPFPYLDELLENYVKQKSR